MILALEKYDGSLFLFASAADAESYFEAVDVENGEYEFCDHTGQRLVGEIIAPVTAFRAGSFRLQSVGAPDRVIASDLVARATCLARGVDQIQSIDDLRRMNAA